VPGWHEQRTGDGRMSQILVVVVLAVCIIVEVAAAQ
jgi:hypothetical protein